MPWFGIDPTRTCKGSSVPYRAHLRPPRLSIVVLPFTNIGGDPEQDYFADGVTESLTTDLSRISGSFVIARNTAFTFKGKAIDVKQVGRDLNVRYVLEGSVQRSGNRLRVNVQLIDAETGNHLWAERFDKPVADSVRHAGRNRIEACKCAGCPARGSRSAASRSVRSNPDSMDLCFQGRAWFNKGLTPEWTTQAQTFFEQVVDAGSGKHRGDARFGDGRRVSWRCGYGRRQAGAVRERRDNA